MSDLIGSAFLGERLPRSLYGIGNKDRMVLQELDLGGLDEERVKRVISDELNASLGREGGELSEARLTAVRYYDGGKLGNEVKDRSEVVMRTVLEAVEWVLPALLRIFTASDKIGLIEPPNPPPGRTDQATLAELERKAEQATDYINHILMRDNDGFLLLHDWFKDALLEKVGWVKYWFDTQKDTETKSFTGLTKEEYDELLGQDADVEVISLEKYLQDQDEFLMDRPHPPEMDLPPPPSPLFPGQGSPIPGAMPPGVPATGAAAPAPLPGSQPSSPPGPGMPPGPTGPAAPVALPGQIPGPLPVTLSDLSPLPPPQIELYDCTLRVTREYGRVRIANVPPEEVLFSQRSKRDDIPFLAHRRRWTYSDLIQQGYDEDCLDLIPMDDSPGQNPELVERIGPISESGEPRDSNRGIWVEESYCKFALDEDEPTSELYKVMTAGGGLVILTKDGKPDIECVDETPFVPLCPIPMPHKLVGLSLADLTMDLQYIKSTLIRQMIDNAFLSNWPRIEVADDAVNENTYDDLLTLRPGGIVRTRRIGGVAPMMIPYTADKSFPLVNYLDEIAQLRTGVSSQGQAITPDALNNTAAASIAMLQQAAAQRVELFARIFANGVEKLLVGVMGLVRRHQQQERIIRVTGGWLRVDPRQWREPMPVVVSVGLGTGNRDQILAHLMTVIQLQGTIVQQQGGVGGPLVYSQNVYDALMALQENAGFKASFFSDPRKGPPPGSPPPTPPPPDPEVMKAQAQIQSQQMKAQADVQAIQVKAQATQSLLAEKAQAEAALSQQRLQHEQQMAQLKAQNELVLERERAQNDLAVAMERTRIEGEVKRREIELKYAAGAYSNEPSPAPNGAG
jgi:hypothetical protein